LQEWGAISQLVGSTCFILSNLSSLIKFKYSLYSYFSTTPSILYFSIKSSNPTLKLSSDFTLTSTKYNHKGFQHLHLIKKKSKFFVLNSKLLSCILKRFFGADLINVFNKFITIMIAIMM